MELDKFRDVDLVIDHVNKDFTARQFVSQNDNDGRSLTVQVKNNGVTGEVPGLMLNLRWSNQANGLTDLSAFELIDKPNSVFQIKYPKNMLNPGKVIASIQIVQNGQISHSKQFEITVQQLAGETKGIIQKAEFSALVKVLGDSNKFRTDIDMLDNVKATKIDVEKLQSQKVDKNGLGQITWGMIGQDAREQISSGKTAVVGKDSVGNLNIIDKSIEKEKASDSFDEYIRLGWYSSNGSFSNFYTTNGTGADEANTYLLNRDAMKVDGSIQKIKLAVSKDSTVSLYVMFGDGTNYQMKSRTDLICKKGENSHDVEIEVEQGDFLAFYGPIVFRGSAEKNTGFQTFSGITEFSPGTVYSADKSAGGYQFGLSIDFILQEQGKSLSLLEQRVMKLEDRSGTQARPDSGIVYFRTKLISNILTPSDISSLEIQDHDDILEDDGILWLPKNYNSKGEAVKLVIFCHGSGETIDHSRTSLPEPFGYLLANGYAIVDVNGIPKSLSGGDGIHFCNPLALQSYLKAYEFVQKNYNVEKEVYLTGMSLGGGMALLLAQTGLIPVKATGVFCPALDLFNHAWKRPWSNNQRRKIASYFDFEDWEDFQFTVNGAASNAEIEFFFNNELKTLGYNPMRFNAINWNVVDPYHSEDEAQAFHSLEKNGFSPVKIWHCADDSVVNPKYSQYYIDSLRNTGNLAHLRTFPSGGHYAWIGGEKIYSTDYDGKTYQVNAAGYELKLWFERF